MDSHDKIYSAYIGEMGDTFQKATIERINWITDKIAFEQRVLDVGCSQGIITILAAEKSGYACGIDINIEAVSYADRLLEEKYPQQKECVEFLCEDFLTKDFPETYDIILLTEVLEHLSEPRTFLEKAKKLLNEDGKVVITVPFGINDHPDHINTFYFTNIVNLFDNLFCINQIDYQGRWMGIVASFSEGSFDLKETLARFEENVYAIDRQMTDRINELYNTVTIGGKRYKGALSNYEKIKVWHKDALEKNNILTEQCARLGNENKNYVEKQRQLTEALLKCSEQIDKDIEVLDYSKAEARKMIIQLDYLKRENAEYRRRLSKITDTWYGQFLMRCYKVLKRIVRGIKRA